MNIQLEPGLELVVTQLACVKATFTDMQAEGLTFAEDERGQAFLFTRLSSPAVFVELIRTLPNKIRGNHVHEHCDETLYVTSGELEIYLLCEHKKHVFKRTLKQGEGVVTPKGTPHALRSLQASECLVLFDKDARGDRERVMICRN